ncbi:MAG: hypothetical protein AAFW69_02895 [Pseudomonadota bacterium]
MKQRFLRAAPLAALLMSVPMIGVAQDVDFGDDSSTWSFDGECDDPRFEGNNMAFILLDEDIGRDATDCRNLFNSGQIRLRDPEAGGSLGSRKGSGTTTAGAVQCDSIDWGDNSSRWAYDNECDDPRFEGQGMHSILLEEDLGADAADCRALCERGLIRPR